MTTKADMLILDDEKLPTISLGSEPDKGTKVTIRVPVRPKKHLISGDGLKGDSTDSAA
jgi:hypothetical protein